MCRDDYSRAIKTIAVWICIGICVLCSACTGKNNPIVSVKEEEQAVKNVLNESLKNRDLPITREIIAFVEDAHVTVTAKRCYVTEVKIETEDGSDYIDTRKEGSDVRGVRVTFVVDWDGFVHEDGHTVLALKYDGYFREVSTAKILETDAKVNINDPKFWLKVGYSLASLAFL
jgi:hypothetical protein